MFSPMWAGYLMVFFHSERLPLIWFGTPSITFYHCDTATFNLLSCLLLRVGFWSGTPILRNGITSYMATPAGSSTCGYALLALPILRSYLPALKCLQMCIVPPLASSFTRCARSLPHQRWGANGGCGGKAAKLPAPPTASQRKTDLW